MGLLTDVHGRGVVASRPAAGHAGRFYFATDVGGGTNYRDNGSSWDTQGNAGLVDPTTTRGDVIIRGASAIGRLAIGAASRVMTSDGTDPSWGQVTPAMLDVSADNTTANASTGHHGLAPKYPNDATKYLDGTGVYSVPAGGGGGSDLVQTSSGAGSVYIPGLRGSPDAKPASPSAFDDEFEALSGWTTLGTLDTSNVSDVASHWHAKRTNGAVAVDGIYKTAPSMPFTVTVKLSASSVQDAINYNSAGILLTESAPGKLVTFGLTTNTNQMYGTCYRWTNRTTFATNVDSALVVDPRYYPLPQFLQLVVASSSSVTFNWSYNGWRWHTAQSAQTTNLTIANVGLYIGDAAAAGTVEAWFDYIRFT